MMGSDGIAADRCSVGTRVRGVTRIAAHHRPSRPLDRVPALLDLYREWYPFSARFLAAASAGASGRPRFDQAIGAPLDLWYELARPEVSLTRKVAERCAAATLAVARRRDARREGESWLAVSAGLAPAPDAPRHVGHFVSLALDSGASSRIVRSAFAEPLAGLYLAAAEAGGGVDDLLAASDRWAAAEPLGLAPGRLADCVRPFLRALGEQRFGPRGTPKPGRLPVPGEYVLGRRGL